MRIADAKTFVVGNPPPHFGGRYFVFLKLVTDDGVEGIGEVYSAAFEPHTLARMIEGVCDRHVLGADPFHIERLWRDVYGRGYSGRPEISLVSVLSGIELACWDIVGKAVGPIQWEDGYVIPPTEPGLGVELDEDVAARHPYVDAELHQVPVYGPGE